MRAAVASTFFAISSAGNLGRIAGLVVQRLPVEHVAQVAALLVLACFLVEALVGLVAEPLLFEHLAMNGGERDIGALVLNLVGLRGEVRGHVREDIDADHIAPGETCRSSASPAPSR